MLIFYFFSSSTNIQNKTCFPSPDNFHVKIITRNTSWKDLYCPIVFRLGLVATFTAITTATMSRRRLHKTPQKIGDRPLAPFNGLGYTCLQVGFHVGQTRGDYATPQSGILYCLCRNSGYYFGLTLIMSVN